MFTTTNNTASSSSTTTLPTNPVPLASSVYIPTYVAKHLPEILEFIKKLYNNNDIDSSWYPDTTPFTRDEILCVLEYIEDLEDTEDLKIFPSLGITEREDQIKFYETILTKDTNELTQYLIYLTPQQSPFNEFVLMRYEYLLSTRSKTPIGNNEAKNLPAYDITIEQHKATYMPSLPPHMQEKQKTLSARAIQLHNEHYAAETKTWKHPKKSAPETHSDSSSLPAPLPTQTTPSSKPKSNWSLSRLFSCCCSSVEDNENSLAVPLVPTATPGNRKGSA